MEPRHDLEPAGTHDRVTTVGLILEISAGLRRIVNPTIEKQLGLGGRDLEVLIRLVRSPGERLRLSDLAAQAALTPSGLTRAIDRLAGLNLVNRQGCPNDRRGTYAVLTRHGHQQMKRVMRIHEKQLDNLFDELLDPAEEQLVTDALRRLRDRVSPDAATIAAPCLPAASPPANEPGKGLPAHA